MDDRIHLYFCILGGAAGFGLVGALFGALARVAFQASGKAAGGVVGAAAVRALEHARGTALSERARGVVGGGSDGACFLGLLGGLLGAYVGSRGGETSVLVEAGLGLAALAVGATLFGLTGYLMASTGVRVVALLFVGGILGALGGAWLDGPDGLLFGAVAGAFLGICLSVRSHDQPPAEEPPAEAHRDKSTDAKEE
jgi:hypothetical protein